VPVKVKKLATGSAGNRQSAYVARNRAAIIKAAQEVLAETGPTASVEQLAEHAQISTTTLYKYFSNKEALFSEALNEIWQSWIAWAYGGTKPGENLESFMDTTRKFFWVKQTHPNFAKILHNVLSNPTFLLNSISSSFENHIESLLKLGLIKSEDYEERLHISVWTFIGLLTEVHVTGKLTPTEAENTLGLILTLWGISESKAKKLIAKKLDFAPVV